MPSTDIAFFGRFDDMYVLGDPVDYDLDRSTSLGAMARRTGADPRELAYDVQLRQDGRQLIYMPLYNFAHGNARRRPRDDHLAGGNVRPVGCRCALRSDLRRQHAHDVSVAVGA